MLPVLLCLFFFIIVPSQLIYLEWLQNEGGTAVNDFTGRIAESAEYLPAIAPMQVSVIICAHNEADNLRQYLQNILAQDYSDASGMPSFEVIVVDDGSSDETADYLHEMAENYPQLKVITLDGAMPKRFPGKKNALQAGLAAAKHEIILMTDADCNPAGNQWIKWMAFPFLTKHVDIVAGFGGFYATSGWLNKFIRCETIHTFMLFCGFARAGKPYMAVGRNLACRKHLLELAQQDPLWAKTPSGDDDMLIRLCATRDNMVVNAHPDSHTYSVTKSTWSEYLLQKQRHVSTGKIYKRQIKFLLGGYALSHTLFWVFFLMIAAGTMIYVEGWYTKILILLLAVMPFLRLVKFYRAVRRTSLELLQKDRLWYFWPIFDISWMLYNIILSPYILWKSKQRWK